jgi:hypothetical protein
VNYAKLLEMNSFFTLHSFLEVDKIQNLPSKFWQTHRDALWMAVTSDMDRAIWPAAEAKQR